MTSQKLLERSHEEILDMAIVSTSAHPFLKRELVMRLRTGFWGATTLEVLVRLAEAQLRVLQSHEQRRAPS